MDCDLIRKLDNEISTSGSSTKMTTQQQKKIEDALCDDNDDNKEEKNLENYADHDVDKTDIAIDSVNSRYRNCLEIKNGKWQNRRTQIHRL